jgi:poly(3-hydroxyalkanoate) depolymerase
MDSEQQAEVNIEHVEVDGVMVRVGIRPGKGVPLLLINGIGANLELTYPFVTALREREIIVFDVPGTGRSGMWWWPRRFPGLAKLAAALLDRLGYRQVDVAGVSWGGALAQQFARQYPRRCRRLILAATSAGAVMVPGRPSVLAKMATPMRYFSKASMEKAAPHIYGGEIRSQPGLVHHHAARVIAPSLMGYLYQMAAGAGWTSVHWLHRLAQPTLILSGDDDPLVPAANAHFMSMLIPNNRVHIVRGGGHLFLVHLLEDVVPVIRRFLEADGSAVWDGLR